MTSTLVRGIAFVALLAALGGCGPAGPGGPGDGSERLHRQAREALDRYDRAVLAAGGKQRFVPVGDLTAQIGDWELDTGENNKQALLAGRLEAAGPLPAAPQPTGTVSWAGGGSLELPLVSADMAIHQLPATSCSDCVPLMITAARMSTATVQTTRGPATVPAWEFTLRGTAVRLTRVAVSASAAVNVVPPSWDPYNAPGGLAISSATTTVGGRQLTAVFTGSPGPGSVPCGVDYTGETVESANAVVVIIVEHPHAPGEMCTDIGATRTATADLAEPLGDRAVLEVQQGRPVPVTVTN